MTEGRDQRMRAAQAEDRAEARRRVARIRDLEREANGDPAAMRKVREEGVAFARWLNGRHERIERVASRAEARPQA